jgi:hypothetical protein
MKDMDRMWHMLMQALMMDMMHDEYNHFAISAERPTDIELDCELDTEKVEEAYAKSEYIKKYE